MNESLEQYGISKAEFNRQIRDAKKRGKERERFEPHAVSVRYADNEIRVTLSTGWSFSFNPRVFPEFAKATEAELSDVKILGKGYTLEWTSLDAHIGVGAIILKLLGDKFLKTAFAKRIGKVKSEKKAASSRDNGRKGGRPKKKENE